MKQNIVIGIDGSAASRVAIRWGLARAKHINAPVTLAYVVDGSFPSESPLFLGVAREAAEQLVATELAYAKTLSFDGTLTSEIAVGNAAREFQRISANSSLLVLGTHTGSKIPHGLLGTTGIKVIAAATVPVAIIPDRPQHTPSGTTTADTTTAATNTAATSQPGQVVVGVDGSPISEAALAFAAAWADRIGATLVAVHAWTPPVTPGLEYLWTDQLQEHQHELAEETLAIAIAGLASQYVDLNIQRKVLQTPPVHALQQTAAEAELLVVGTHGRGAFTRLLLGSVSHSLLNHVPCPMIVVKNV